MKAPTKEETTCFVRQVQELQSGRDSRFIQFVAAEIGVKYTPPKSEYESEISFDVRDPKVSTAIENAIIAEASLTRDTLGGADLIKWFSEEPAMQLALRSEFKPITDDDVRRVVRGRLKRICDKAGDTEHLKRRMTFGNTCPTTEEVEARATSEASISFVPYEIGRWVFRCWDWYADIGLAISGYTSGRRVDAEGDFLEQIDKAVSGLEAFLQATESRSARFFARSYGSYRYPLAEPDGVFDKLISGRIAGLKAMQERAEALRLIKRKDKYSRERAFLVDVFHSNYRCWGSALLKATKRIAQCGFLDNPIEEKTVKRVHDLVKAQKRAYYEIKDVGRDSKGRK